MPSTQKRARQRARQRMSPQKRAEAERRAEWLRSQAKPEDQDRWQQRR